MVLRVVERVLGNDQGVIACKCYIVTVMMMKTTIIMMAMTTDFSSDNCISKGVCKFIRDSPSVVSNNECI